MSFIQLLPACIGFGFGGECFRQWRAYKKRRALLTIEQRNSGFWTDTKLRIAESSVWVVLFGIPLSGFVILRGMS